MTKEQLLAMVEDVLRTVPPTEAFTRKDESQTLPWIGRALAALTEWNAVKAIAIGSAVDSLNGFKMTPIIQGLSQLQTLLYQARADLQMQTGHASLVVQEGHVFDYFDELRKVVEGAGREVFFVDAYLDAEFVSRYLPYARDGVGIRLLGGSIKMATLLPAVDLFARQNGRGVAVRSSSGLHDRYLFVDGAECYLSGASFKDGAKNAPAVLTKITDAFSDLWNTYDRVWQAARVERS